MKFFCIVFIALLTCLAAVLPVWGHGVEGYTEAIEGYCITAQYDDGEPMAYAAVEIKSPGADIAFQTGRTDRNGCFMFYPDGEGLWQATVQDGMGHRLALSVKVGEQEKSLSPEAASPASLKGSRPLKALVGVSVIFGATGVAYGWRSRRRSNRKKGDH